MKMKLKVKLTRWKKFLRVLIVTALLIPTSSGCVMGGINYKMKRDARGEIFKHDDDNIPTREVAIVLGARVMPDGEPSTSLRDRLFVAKELYRRGKVKKILVTGDHGTRGYNEVRAMYAWLRERGVPASKIYVDHAGLRTLDSMRRAAEVFKVEDAIICTQEFHLARSLFLAESYGIDAVGVLADQRIYAKRKANRQREFIARVVAFVDVHVLDRQPRHWGDEIPITGPAQSSHDKVILTWEKNFKGR